MAAHGRSVAANVVVPIDFPYNYRVGAYLEKYIQGLGQGKIYGIKCPGCGKVVVPPRKICGACNEIMEDYVEVGPEGTVEDYTVGHVKINLGQLEPVDPPQIIGLVKLEGADSLLAALIKGVEPGDLGEGLRVRAVFKDPPKDSLEDLDYFEPVE